MPNLHDLLADEMARQPDVPTPPFDALLARSRRRRAVIGCGSALAAVAAVVAAIVIPNVVTSRGNHPAAGIGQALTPSAVTGPLITSGTCAGLAVIVTHGYSSGATVEGVLAAPAQNMIRLTVGDFLSFTARGPCANTVTYIGATGPLSVPAKGPPPARNTSTQVFTATGSGTATIGVSVPMCGSDPACQGGQQPPIATITITVQPATSPTASANAESSIQHALATCQVALGPAVVSASATTVGDIRGWDYGPAAASRGTEPPHGIQPGKDAFAGDAPDAFAAWCWTGKPSDWVSWGVDLHGQKVRMAEITGPTTGTDTGVPTGGPMIP
jgi:hypothetical protein